MTNREEVVLGSMGEPILYCIMRDGFLEASFEIYGNKDQSDLEIIDSIPPSEFPKLPSYFNYLQGLRYLML